MTDREFEMLLAALTLFLGFGLQVAWDVIKWLWNNRR